MGSEKTHSTTLTVPVVIDRESYFIVSARAAQTFSTLNNPIRRNKINLKRASRIKNRDYETAYTLEIYSGHRFWFYYHSNSSPNKWRNVNSFECQMIMAILLEQTATTGEFAE